MEFQPSQKQTQFATYNSIFTPNKCKETGKEAPTIQEGTYQTHRKLPLEKECATSLNWAMASMARRSFMPDNVNAPS